MKMKHFKSFSVILLLSLSAILFQNLAMVDLSEYMLPEINEEIRASHAAELLGDKVVATGTTKMQKRIYGVIRQKMPSLTLAQKFNLAKTIIDESQKYHFDPMFTLAIIQTESQFDPKTVGQFGEIGLMQIKPSTAEWISDKYHISEYHDRSSLFNPSLNVRVSLAYMNHLRHGFDYHPEKYVNAYNLGPKRLKKGGKRLALNHKYEHQVLTHYQNLYNNGYRQAMN